MAGVATGVARATPSSFGANRPLASRAKRRRRSSLVSPSNPDPAPEPAEPALLFRARFLVPPFPVSSFTTPLAFITFSTEECAFCCLTPFGRSVFPEAAAAAFAEVTAASCTSHSCFESSVPFASRYTCPVKCAWNHRARHCCAVRFSTCFAMALQLAPCATRNSASRRSSPVLQVSLFTRGSRCLLQRPMHCWSVLPSMWREMSAQRKPWTSTSARSLGWMVRGRICELSARFSVFAKV